MVKHVYFHVGMPKTGTTALQDFFLLNKTNLEQHGIGFFVPKNGEQRRRKANGKFLLFKSKEIYSEFSEYSKKYDVLILSEELFWILGTDDPKIWGDTFELINELVGEGVRIHPIVYLRRQDEWILSMWREWLTHYEPYIYTFEETVQKQKEIDGFDYYKQLKNIESVFGRENMIVRVYERNNLEKEDICYDFISAINLSWNNSFQTIKEANKSITLDVANALLYINSESIRYNNNENRSSIRSGAKLYSRMYPEKERTHMMRTEERKALLSFCDETNRKVSDIYFNGEELFDKKVLSCKKWNKNSTEIIKIAQEIIKLTKVPYIVRKALLEYVDNMEVS